MRELSWLLYIAAWAQLEQSAALAVEAKSRLQDVTRIMEGLGHGNESEAYLMRALAVWAWRTGDHEAREALQPYLTVLQERMYQQEPGPLCSTFVFLSLSTEVDRIGKLPDWPTIQSVLEAMNHWLEIAILASIAEKADVVKRSLARYQSLRKDIVTDLAYAPSWMEFSSTDWSNVAGRAAQRESVLLLDDRPVAPEELIAEGLIPL